MHNANKTKRDYMNPEIKKQMSKIMNKIIDERVAAGLESAMTEFMKTPEVVPPIIPEQNTGKELTFEETFLKILEGDGDVK